MTDDWNEKVRKRTDELIDKIKALPLKEALQEALSWRSDDFYHSVHDCQVATEVAFEVLGEKCIEALDRLSQLESDHAERVRGLVEALGRIQSGWGHEPYGHEAEHWESVDCHDVREVAASNTRVAREALAQFAKQASGASTASTRKGAG